VHHLQGEAELVTDLVPLLQEFYREKLTSVLRHQAAARHVAQYDANNTYQYIINREDAHLSWVGRAIVDLGGEVPPNQAEPERTASGKGSTAANNLFEEDARHRGMLRVILGEVLEQKRFFEQALAGRTDLLGRRTEGVGKLEGEVLPTRWIE
jgi:rubrerythrin